MFTGIIEELGEVVRVSREPGLLEVACERVLDRTDVGGSIAVDGCCLTVTRFLEGRPGFAADLMAQTLRVTTLGALEPGAAVNLERPLAADGRFGGHLVQGHVDGVGTVIGRDERPGTVTLRVRAPDTVARYLAPRGSVAVAGVSLTVIDVTRDVTRDVTGDGPGDGFADGLGGVFEVGLIPHTQAVTTLGSLQVGDRVNLEADVVARHVVEHAERYLGTREGEGP